MAGTGKVISGQPKSPTLNQEGLTSDDRNSLKIAGTYQTKIQGSQGRKGKSPLPQNNPKNNILYRIDGALKRIAENSAAIKVLEEAGGGGTSLGDVNYKGTYNATTNTPPLSDPGTKGDYYVVSVAGTQDFGSGPISFEVGDWVISNGVEQQKVDNTQAPVLTTNIIHVDKSGNDATGTGTVEAPYLTIQAGIDAAAVGNVILVNPGTYAENITFAQENTLQGNFEVDNITVPVSDVIIKGEIECDIINVNAAANDVKINIFRVKGASSIAGDRAIINITEVTATITLAGDNAEVDIAKSAPTANQAVVINGNDNNVEFGEINAAAGQNGFDVNGDGNAAIANVINIDTGNGFSITGTGANTCTVNVINISGGGNGVNAVGTGTLNLKITECNCDGASSYCVAQTNPALSAPDINGEIGCIYINGNNVFGIGLTSATNALFTFKIGKILQVSGTGTRGLSFETQGGNTIQACVEFEYIEAVIAAYVDGGTDLNVTGTYIEGTTNCIVTNNNADAVYGFASDKVGTDSVFGTSTVVITTPGGVLTGVPETTLYVDPNFGGTITNITNGFVDLASALAWIDSQAQAYKDAGKFRVIVDEGVYAAPAILIAPVDIIIEFKGQNTTVPLIQFGVDFTTSTKSTANISIVSEIENGVALTNGVIFDAAGVVLNDNVNFSAKNIEFQTLGGASIVEANVGIVGTGTITMEFEGGTLGGTFNMPVLGTFYRAEKMRITTDGNVNSLYDILQVFPGIAPAGFFECDFITLSALGPGIYNPWTINMQKNYTAIGIPAEFTLENNTFILPIGLLPGNYVPFPFDWNFIAGVPLAPAAINLGENEVTAWDTFALAISITGAGTAREIQGRMVKNEPVFFLEDPVAAGYGGVANGAVGYYNGIEYRYLNSAWHPVYAQGTTAARPAAAASANGLRYFNTDIQHFQEVIDGAWETVPLTTSSAGPPPGPIANPQEGDRHTDTSTTPATEWTYTNGAWVAVPRSSIQAAALPGTFTSPNEGDRYMDTTAVPQKEYIYTNGAWVARERTYVEAVVAPGAMTVLSPGDRHVNTAGAPGAQVEVYDGAAWRT